MNSSYLFFNRLSFRNCISCVFCFFLNFIFFSCWFCFFLPDTISIINSCTIFYTALINRFFMIGYFRSLRLCWKNVRIVQIISFTFPTVKQRLLLFYTVNIHCYFFTVLHFHVRFMHRTFHKITIQYNPPLLLYRMLIIKYLRPFKTTKSPTFLPRKALCKGYFVESITASTISNVCIFL